MTGTASGCHGGIAMPVAHAKALHRQLRAGRLHFWRQRRRSDEIHGAPIARDLALAIRIELVAQLAVSGKLQRKAGIAGFSG
ncbi:hypothetical protein [Derxia lacustris]|uniref:hypothetical protein n=1 Tax=Derxia lacustris TaxID=764842 RepID=UPI00111BCE4A|nr:hypothetical protein [Derxia lacustris]